MCGSVRPVDGSDGGGVRRKEVALCAEVRRTRSPPERTVMCSALDAASLTALGPQAAPAAAGGEPAAAAPRGGRAALHPGESARQPDERLQPVGVHRSQHAVGPGAEHPRDGGRGNEEGEGETQRPPARRLFFMSLIFPQ